jgi:hypothetical protein
MSEAEHDEELVEDQQIECAQLDVGGGTECLRLDEEWVAYLAEVDLPGNVTGVDTGIADFGGEEWANV